MSVNPELLRAIAECCDRLEFTLSVQDRQYHLTNVSIAKAPTPVTRPTTRGGVYFSPQSVYKMSGIVKDPAVMQSLSGAMLGPNERFGDMLITTALEYEGKVIRPGIHAHLVSSVQSPSEIQLCMIIIQTDV